MGFKENLKSQLQYSGMMVKELETLSGVKKRTIDSYLGTRKFKPSAENAYNIAKALGVSVEYLMTGVENKKERPLSSLHKDVQEIALISEQLDQKDRHTILSLAKILKNK
jgi:transcriptional regulator with XRE-family HTH domain